MLCKTNPDFIRIFGYEGKTTEEYQLINKFGKFLGKSPNPLITYDYVNTDALFRKFLKADYTKNDIRALLKNCGFTAGVWVYASKIKARVSLWGEENNKNLIEMFATKAFANGKTGDDLAKKIISTLTRGCR